MIDYLPFNMSELVPFFTGLAFGLAVAAFTKGKAKNVQSEIVSATKLIKAAVNVKGEYKMVFVVRNDLGMTKGKVATQCAHATLMCYNVALESCPDSLKFWSRTGQAKIALKLDSSNAEQEILKLAEKANKLGVVTSLVRDAGRTQVQKGTVTVLGLGPSPVKLIDEVSGHLKLL